MVFAHPFVAVLIFCKAPFEFTQDFWKKKQPPIAVIDGTSWISETVEIWKMMDSSSLLAYLGNPSVMFFHRFPTQHLPITTSSVHPLCYYYSLENMLHVAMTPFTKR